MHENAFGYEIWSGINWFGTEKEKQLKHDTVLSFEKRHNITLPAPFFHYLRLFNGRSLHFPVDDFYTIFIKLFSIDKLDEIAKTSLAANPNILWIGTDHEESSVGLYIGEGHVNYGKLVIEKKNQVNISEYPFEKAAYFAQTSPTQPEIFAAQENDVSFLKKSLESGWDYKSVYSYQNAVTEAASYNSHEALELLLQHGARLKFKEHRKITWTYDEKTMDILDKYP